MSEETSGSLVTANTSLYRLVLDSSMKMSLISSAVVTRSETKVTSEIDPTGTGVERLRKSLLKREIETKIHRYKNRKIFGISFRKSNLAFKGSTIRQDFSYKGLQKQLDHNLKNQRGLSI